MREKKLFRVEIRVDMMVMAHDDREALEIAHEQAQHEVHQSVHPKKVTEVRCADDVTPNWSRRNPGGFHERKPIQTPQLSINQYLEMTTNSR